MFTVLEISRSAETHNDETMRRSESPLDNALQLHPPRVTSQRKSRATCSSGCREGGLGCLTFSSSRR